LVGKVDAYEHVSSLLLLVSHDERVKSLGVENILEVAKHAHGALQVMHDTIDFWRASEWVTERANGDELIQAYQVAQGSYGQAQGGYDGSSEDRLA